MKKFAILVAAGSGSRMKSETPKQFMLLGGKPVLMQTIFKFFQADSSVNLILVLPESHIPYWNELCITYNFKVQHVVVAGGSTRFNSVKNGLHVITENGLVAVHDGVRPLISSACINALYHDALIYGSAVPVIPVQDSLRHMEEGNKSSAVDRSRFRIVQTPQIFMHDKLQHAFNQPFQPAFTDEATVMEAAGESVHLTDGEPANIKITTVSDLRFAASVFSA